VRRHLAAEAVAGTGHRALTALASLVLGCALCCGSAAAPPAGAIRWGPLVHVAPHPHDPSVMNGVSCPSVSFCVAVDGEGDALTSRNPGGDTPDWRWVLADPSNPAGTDGAYLTAVSCPSERLCVAVDSSGNAVTSTNPAAASPSWSLSDIDGSRDLRAVSCPSRRLCVAVDGSGNVVTTASPATVGARWWVRNVAASRTLTGVSCPTSTLCVTTAVGRSGGDVYMSADPRSADAAWHALSELVPHALQSVSCPSPGFCAVTDIAGHVLVSTHPLGGRHAWRAFHPDATAARNSRGFILSAISCASPQLCVAVDDVGKAIWSLAPATDAWTVTPRVDATRPLRGVACPSRRLCLAVDANGNIIAGGYSAASSPR
jgi:hypothetical protein